MRRMALPALILALAIVAVVGVYALATAAGQRPMTGQVELFGGPTGEDCDAESYRLVLDGTGTLAHAGLVSITATNCSIGDLNIEDAQIVNGSATFAAADGSTITTTYQGNQSKPAAGSTIGDFTTSHTVTGGTGRFAGARGSWTIAGTADIEVGHLLAEVTGWLSY